MNSFARGFTIHSVWSWPTITLAVIWAAMLNLGDSAVNGLQSPIIRVVSVATFVLAQFLFTWLVDRLLLRRLRPTMRAAILLVTLLGFGAARGAAVSLMMEVVAGTPSSGTPGRMVAAMIQTSEIALFAFAYGLLLATARQRAELVATRNRLSALAERAKVTQKADDAALIERVRVQLRAGLSWTPESSASDVLRVLNRSIEEIVRPLSHSLRKPPEELLADEHPPRTRVNWASAWRETLRGNQLRLGWTTALLWTMVMFPCIVLFGPLGFLIAGGMAGSVSAVTVMVRQLARRIRLVESTSTLFALVGGALAMAGLFWFLFPANIRISYVVISIPVVTLTVIVPALITVALQQSEEITEQLKLENSRLTWAIARSNELSRQRRAALSAALHGSVQSALAAAHLRLQIAIRDDSDAEAAAVAAKVEAERAVALGVEPLESRPIADQCMQLTAAWAGAVEVHCEVPNEIDADQVTAQLIAEIMTEGVLNAVKHANASWVHIRAEINGDFVTLSIENPGDLARKDEPGGGTRLLETSAISWSLQSMNQTTRLSALLPYEGKP